MKKLIFGVVSIAVLFFGSYFIGKQISIKNQQHINHERDMESSKVVKKTGTFSNKKLSSKEEQIEKLTVKDQAEQASNKVGNVFFITEYEGDVIVYEEDKKTIFEYTDISVENLPLSVKNQVIEGFFLTEEEEVYSFLETYSS